MASNRPDPGDFLQQAQRMLRELFGDPRGDDAPWAEATRPAREPSAEQQRENLTFALATRAVEALEDLLVGLEDAKVLEVALGVALVRAHEVSLGAHEVPASLEHPGHAACPAAGEPEYDHAPTLRSLLEHATRHLTSQAFSATVRALTAVFPHSTLSLA
jgi:hypothetical protein